ncbi:NifU family protein [Streptomyces sp. NPDC001388]|uniref:NifU family protein n=1 Tax=Streptomyces sp. NPDC001388 TaxID=3364568 RepID=UPI00368CFCB2
MIPLHPQPLPGRPRQMRWIVPAGTLACTGPATAVPAPLAALLADGTLTRVVVEPSAVVTDLGENRSWPGDGARIRTALHRSLEHPADWRTSAEPAGDGHAGGDAALYAAARELLAGPSGRYARSHGGTIDLVEVREGVVTVRLGGTCDGCPAAWITLQHRLERLLRERCPHLVEVRQTGPGGRVSRLIHRAASRA